LGRPRRLHGLNAFSLYAIALTGEDGTAFQPEVETQHLWQEPTMSSNDMEGLGMGATALHAVILA
jgi:hypothetical protein